MVVHGVAVRMLLKILRVCQVSSRGRLYTAAGLVRVMFRGSNPSPSIVVGKQVALDVRHCDC